MPSTRSPTPSIRDISISRREPASLSLTERDALFAFVTAFIPYPRARFDKAIDPADYLWLAHDRTGAIVGTSVVRVLSGRLRGREVKVVYTAMAVVDAACRRLALIPRFGVRTFLRERLRAGFSPMYWLFLAASPAGFLQMAHNASTYWPRPGVPMPDAERELLRQLLAQLGMERIEEVEGCFRLPDDFGVTDPTQDGQYWNRSDPSVDFFLRVNPDYQRGSDSRLPEPVHPGAAGRRAGAEVPPQSDAPSARDPSAGHRAHHGRVNRAVRGACMRERAHSPGVRSQLGWT